MQPIILCKCFLSLSVQHILNTNLSPFSFTMNTFRCLVFLWVLFSSSKGQNPFERIQRDIFVNDRIDASVMPTSEVSGQVLRVEHHAYMLNTLRVDESRGISTLNLWVQYRWKDPRIKWEPKDYSNVTAIRVPSEKVWTPVIAHADSMNFKNTYVQGNPMVHLYNTGDLIWVPPATYNIPCKMDHKNFPFDEHVCRLTLTSWVHTANEINLTSHVINNADYWVNPSWDMSYTTPDPAFKGLSSKDRRDTANLPTISYEFRFTRRSTYYQNIMFTSIVAAMFLTLTVFFVPCDKPSRRHAVSICSFLVLFLLTLHISIQVPFGGEHAPKIYHLCNALLILTAITVPISAILGCFVQRDHSSTVPSLLKMLSQTRFNRQVDVLDDLPDDNAIDWTLAASAIDRVCLTVYVVSYIIILITCLS